LVSCKGEEVPNIAIAIFHALLVKIIYQLRSLGEDFILEGNN
jgi:hypothetical protein